MRIICFKLGGKIEIWQRIRPLEAVIMYVST